MSPGSPPKSPPFHRGPVEHILSPLERLRAALRRFVLTEGVCLCAGITVGLAAIQLFLDRALLLGLGPRAALLAVCLSLIAQQAYRRILLPVARPVSLEDVAALLEAKNRDYRDMLISVVAFAGAAESPYRAATNNPSRNSPALVDALVRTASRRFSSLPTDNLLRRDRHRGFVLLGSASVAAVAATAFVAPQWAATYLQRNVLLRDVPWPASAQIVLEGFEKNRERRFPLGDDLKIVARALDQAPPSLRAEVQLTSGASSIREMVRQGASGFFLDFGPLTQSMQLRLLIGKFGVDERTDWYRIEAVERPGVKTVRVRVSPPHYAGTDPYDLPPGRVGADLIRGSSVDIDALMSKLVVSAELKARSDEESVASATVRDGSSVSVSFAPTRSDSYYFDLRDEFGLEDKRPVTFSFDLITDPPPKVRLTLPGSGEMVVSGAVLDVAVECEDNLGLKAVQLSRRIERQNQSNPSPPATAATELPGFVPGQQRFSASDALPLLPLTLTPGDRLTLQAVAVDHQPPMPVEAEQGGDPTASNQGRSEAHTLRVVTPEEFLSELGRREHEWRREFEMILKTQEQLNRRILELDDENGASTERLLVRFGQEARTQRQQIGRLKAVLRQFEQILGELAVNQLDTPTVRRRLHSGVILPMRDLIGEEVPTAAEMIEQLRNRFDPSLAEDLERQQIRIVQLMYAILAEMIKWEGYNEAVGLLRDILRLQEEVNKDTQRQLEGEMNRLFGNEPDPEADPEE